jgi:endonuclease/exonuclease/phosphatase family metal-dependent hydrolase
MRTRAEVATIAAASYNVHRCIGRDGRHDPERVARVLRELDADVVALQEVSARRGRADDVDQCEHLARAAGMEAVRGPTLRSQRGEIGNALLTRLQLERLERIDLSQPKREPRGVIDVDLRAGPGSLRVLATHLGLRLSERRAQVETILDALGESPSECTVLLGDMNDWTLLRGAVRRFDAWFGRSPTPRTFPAWRPLLALDRIWVRPRAALQEVTVHASRAAREASDHLPLRCVVRLEPDAP